VVLLIVLRVIAMTCRIMLTVVLLYARQNVCVLYNKPLNLGVLVDDSLLFWLAVRFLRQTNVHLCLLKALFISEKASYHTRHGNQSRTRGGSLVYGWQGHDSEV